LFVQLVVSTASEIRLLGQGGAVIAVKLLTNIAVAAIVVDADL